MKKQFSSKIGNPAGKLRSSRVLIEASPYANTFDPNNPWNGSGIWPASWIGTEFQPPFVAVYRLRFTSQGQIIRVHVSADERYELFLDGERIGRGPERGDRLHWFFETYDLGLEAGDHILSARSWALGDLAPEAQVSACPGFLLCPDDERYLDLLATGRANWQVKQMGGYTFVHPLAGMGIGHKVLVDGKTFSWGFEIGAGEDWMPAQKLHPGYNASTRGHLEPEEHLLLPATLPPMLEETRHIGRVCNISAPTLSATHSVPIRAADHIAAEEPAWSALLAGRGFVTVPPNTRRRVLIDLQNYYCAYEEIVVSGGDRGMVRVHWQESLFDDIATGNKGKRGEVQEKYFTTIWWNQDGIGNTFQPDGGDHRRFDGLWWNAGRYVEVLVETNNQSLVIESLAFRETRYPLESESRFRASDPRLEKVVSIMTRALQMCSHETYMDCPFYEQLMYIGDARIEALVTYLTSRDDRLPRKALRMFDISRLATGLTQSRYPSRQRQIIPTFSLWWVGMVNDYLAWRGDVDFVRTLMPGVRTVLDAFINQRDADKLVHSPAGWNTMDWVPEWPSGVFPGGETGGVSGLLNWQYVYALAKAAEIEDILHEPEMASRASRLARETAAVLDARYWDEARGLYADDFQHAVYSEHSQCLAVLSGILPAARRTVLARNLFSAGNMAPSSVYFMHYFFETCRELERMDMFMQRMKSWFEMVDYDFKTTYESGDPHNVRSDCHAWSAHPLYHYFASLLGIRPAGPGFERVEVRPQLASLTEVRGAIVHPRGEVRADLRLVDGKLTGAVALPAGVTGQFVYGGMTIPLVSGKNKI